MGIPATLRSSVVHGDSDGKQYLATHVPTPIDCTSP
jgi:hypothetical protein